MENLRKYEPEVYNVITGKNSDVKRVYFNKGL